MIIGENIKRIRTEKKLTQKQLGDLCGMADSAIRRYELGKANPKIETVEKIAKAMNVEIFDLMEVPFESFDNSENYTPHPDKDHILNDVYTANLLDAFNSLNASGKQRAVSQVQLVASIPEYQKNPPAE